LVDKRAKAEGPEGFPDRHLHRSVFRQPVKYAFRIQRVIDGKQPGEALRLFILLGKRVGAHQNGIANCESRMKDFLAPFRWRFFRHGRIAPYEHVYDFAAKASFIKLPPKHRS